MQSKAFMGINAFTGQLASCFLIVSLAPAAAGAENFWRGQELYADHCDACHDSLSHPGKEQKVKSVTELRERISSWAEHTGLNWGNRDIDDVLNYLNKSYYHFKGKEP